MKRPSSTYVEELCIHLDCFGSRHVVPLSAVMGVSRRMQGLGLESAIAGLLRVISPADDVSFCYECGCLFAAYSRHPH